MGKPLRETLEITEWDMHRPCTLCGSADCDPDDMDVWVTHLVTWHGYKVTEDAAGSRDGEKPRTIRLAQVGWSTAARFSPNQSVNVKVSSHQRELAGRRGTVVGYNSSTSEFAVTFAEKPSCGVLLPGELDAATSR